MIVPHANVALVIGHPGHELRIYRFMELYKPVVFVLTDGSGSAASSRIDKTRRIIQNTGCTEGGIIARFTDKEIYNHILQKNHPVFRSLAGELGNEFAKHDIDVVAGDSNEGFSPTHDLCRYIINCAVRQYALRKNKNVPNYEFYLEAAPDKFPKEKESELMQIHLDAEQFDRKYRAALEYPELAFELKRFLEMFGKKPFQTEYLWPVISETNPVGWQSALPDYETTGKQRMADGIYADAITFSHHLLPIAQQLYDESSFYK